MESLGRAVVVLVLALLLAGCGGADGDGDQTTPTATGTGGGTGGDGGDNETEETPPEPQEVLNETLDFARAPEQMGESTTFDVPQDPAGLRLTFQGEHDCPTDTLGYQDDAEVVFTDPNGEEYSENLFDSGAGSVDCNNPPLVHTINPTPVAGGWEVRTEGVYTGMVHVTGLVNPPDSA